MTRQRSHAGRAANRRSGTGPTVLVTGGSGGIGRALCRAFGQAGWKVGVHYHTRPRDAARTAALVRRLGGQALLIRADIRDRKQARDMVAQLVDRWGRLDVVLCNAGTAESALVARTDAEAWEAILSTNLTGTFHCLLAAGAIMTRQRDGSVIVIGSLSGHRGAAGQAAYAAAKAGLTGLVKTAAREWGRQNVRVNLVLPGWHRTRLAGAAFPERPVDHALGRTPSLELVARTIAHLSMHRDSSGQVWNLDSRIL